MTSSAALRASFPARFWSMLYEWLITVMPPAFPTLISNDGIHPTQKGHDLVHRCVEEVFS